MARKKQNPSSDIASTSPSSAPLRRSNRNYSEPKKPKIEVNDKNVNEESRFIGNPVPDDEARRRWPYRYLSNDKTVAAVSVEASKGTEPPKEFIQAKRHFTEAIVDGHVHFMLGDYASCAGEGESYICRVVEMFEDLESAPKICIKWFYRAKDTIIGKLSDLIDDKRIFISELQDDNPLDCLIDKLKIVRVPLNTDVTMKQNLLSDGNYYYDMLYLPSYSTYQKLPSDSKEHGNEYETTISSICNSNTAVIKDLQAHNCKSPEVTLLDLYAGCGAMSTGLCLGANIGNVNLVVRWAVDINAYACESLKFNHPETNVRNESAENFLQLLKEWEKLCHKFSLVRGSDSQLGRDPVSVEIDETHVEDDETDDDSELDEEVYEVEKILSIMYGDPKENGNPGLYFKIRWKSYGPESDTWEPADGLGDCQKKIKEFVKDGLSSKILPLPGDVDVICGGPPCQGVSGFNRFRNKDEPLEDEKNQQLVVYMDVVEHLKPKLVLMENVVDILKFSDGYLGRYALTRLISLNYQARIGLLAAGCYGLPQFRTRMFLWGARHDQKLPQYPLPTHNVVSRGACPVEFAKNAVINDDQTEAVLEKELYLWDAISDLPAVTNDEKNDEVPYEELPKTEFQKFIRLKKEDMPGYSRVDVDSSDHMLYDHLPYECNEDDYQRICRIPKEKGANFRNLEGVWVRDDNHVEWDPNIERVCLSSGKPLVPDYAMTYVKGKSSKPFRRLWWDETVPTVVTRPQPHNQAIIHPEQDRVLSIRENARLQGFPDHYKLVGPVKERYVQVGNAVAVPVARALGYALAMSWKGTADEKAVFQLPKKFPNLERVASPITEQNH
uniref:DNA (cytosine-5)-methyltransferase 1-like n=1 Tax=Erigeron canadensis TaxID=72917 RepID=UPI001CB98FB9|nr:DNA (cytosine-5)-methyltransferase 1-like [Erigeron canadensis]